MVEVKDLFEQRAETFNELTQQILESLPNVLEGCRIFVSKNGANPGLLEWEDVSFYDEHNIIMLVASLTYSPGDVIKLPEGEVIELTNDNVENFKSTLQLGIPYELAKKGTPDDVFTFLTATIEQEEAEQLGGAERSITVSDETPTQAEFDLEELTEEQKEALKMSVQSMRNSKN